jgi:transposase
MGEVSTAGRDIAKSVFQIHGVDRDGEVAIRKRVSHAKLLEFFARLPPCVIGIEACPTAHHWSRELQALGHTVTGRTRDRTRPMLQQLPGRRPHHT